MTELLTNLEELYWQNRDGVLLGAVFLGSFCVPLALLVWVMGRMSELSAIRERMSRLADGLALLTDATEAGLAALAAARAELPQQTVRNSRATTRASVAKRVIAAARKGEQISSIAERETLSESEVRLHLALSDRDHTEAPAPLAS